MVRMLAAHPGVPVPPCVPQGPSLPPRWIPYFSFIFLFFNHSVIYYPCLQMPLIQIKLNLLTLLLAPDPCCTSPPLAAGGWGWCIIPTPERSEPHQNPSGDATDPQHLRDYFDLKTPSSCRKLRGHPRGSLLKWGEERGAPHSPPGL